MSHDVIQLTLNLESGSVTEMDELLEWTARLRTDLADTEIDTIRTGHANVPHTNAGSTKGVDPATAQLYVTLAVGVIPTIILVIQAFLLRQKDQTLKVRIKEVELEIPRHASEEEINRLIKIVEKLAKKVN